MLPGDGYAPDRGRLQSAGVLPVDLAGWGAAFVAMPGHKGLYGPQGTGLLLCGAEGKPLLYGGTGSMSRLQDMPPDLPDRLEPGPTICRASRDCWRASGSSGGRGWRASPPGAAGGPAGRPGPGESAGGAGILGSGASASDRRGILRDGGPGLRGGGGGPGRRGIALRAGLHCAPLAHRTAGTLDTGTLRLSASFFNTPDQADRLVWAVSRVLRENVEL